METRLNLMIPEIRCIYNCLLFSDNHRVYEVDELKKQVDVMKSKSNVYGTFLTGAFCPVVFPDFDSSVNTLIYVTGYGIHLGYKYGIFKKKYKFLSWDDVSIDMPQDEKQKNVVIKTKLGDIQFNIVSFEEQKECLRIMGMSVTKDYRYPCTNYYLQLYLYYLKLRCSFGVYIEGKATDEQKEKLKPLEEKIYKFNCTRIGYEMSFGANPDLSDIAMILQYKGFDAVMEYLNTLDPQENKRLQELFTKELKNMVYYCPIFENLVNDF